jgi:hypothetical protein
MKLFAKSFVAGVIATGLFFSFLVMLVLPATALMERLHGPTEAQDVVVSPMPFLRDFGVPLSALVFLMTFGLSLRQFAPRKPAAGSVNQPQAETAAAQREKKTAA